MSTYLSVHLYRDGAEVHANSLSENEVYEIILSINTIWQGVEKAPLFYRALPAQEGLLIAAGTFDECRCSDAEVNLHDPWDLDDHHFLHHEFPEGLEDKTVPFEDEEGKIQQRFLLEDYHPVGHNGMLAVFR